MIENLKERNQQLIEEFRANGRRLTGRPLLLLTTTGARTGRPHTTPMMLVEDRDRVLVIASAAGGPRHPAWYHTLVANPAVTVERDGETYAATAVPLTGEDRDETFARIVERYPFFAEHQAGVSRRIPVIALQHAAA
ncbi:MAG: cell entry protein [Actinobacteria bacterium 13_2_20CM_2_72_6]|nr:MAG: cell entry protein [Actinobacteria bacterium 13_2_20CM_2_72_6]